MVTGKVDDIRPYLQHASVVVAPLRIARGVQNKVLEGMAMAKAMVVSSAAAEGLAVTPSIDIEVAADAHEFAEKTLGLLSSRKKAEEMGRAARARALREYGWEVNLKKVGELLTGASGDPGRTSRDASAGARTAEHIDEA